MPRNFTVDDTLFRAQAKKLVKRLKKDETIFIRQQAALYARLMAKVTPPHTGGAFPKMSGVGYQQGGANATISQGRAAIVADMGTMFVIKSEGYLKSLHDITGKLRNIRRTLTNGKGVRYVVDVDEINYNSVGRALKWHQDHRRPSSGRAVNKDQGSNDPRIGRWTARDKMWVSPRIWNAVMLAKFENIGMSKAAWASAAVKLGIKKGPPVYIRNLMAGSGTRVTVQKNPSVVTITASSPGMPHSIRAEPRVRKFRTIAMVKGLEKLVKFNAKKAGFKTR